jgi:hypothetical protein
MVVGDEMMIEARYHLDPGTGEDVRSGQLDGVGRLIPGMEHQYRRSSEALFEADS